jgi:hypothetical protein
MKIFQTLRTQRKSFFDAPLFIESIVFGSFHDF